MRYLSVCYGIEAASVAWHSLGWGPLAFSEIEAFPRAVLEYHYPDVPLYGDFTKLRDEDFIADADVLVGGTPCQAFSVAGLRESLDDDRGNLSLEFVRLADAIDDLRHAAGREPAIVVWENVPGVLSVKDNAFGCFLAALAGDVTPYDPPRGKWTDAGVVAGPSRAVAWRVLDAQYFGLAQRRRRVFVVASAREGFDPAAVLLEWEGVRRDTAPSRKAREGSAHSTAPCLTSSGRGVERTGETRGQDPVAFSYKDNGNDASADLSPTLRALGAYDANGGGQMGVAYAFQPRIARNGRGDMGEIVNALNAQSGETGKGDAAPCVAFSHFQDSEFGCKEYDTAAIRAGRIPEHSMVLQQHMAVRRLTPVECERLQGFPDNYTLIPWKKKPADQCPDGPRYKALGNSMAVPVMRWIGSRIAEQVK